LTKRVERRFVNQIVYKRTYGVESPCQDRRLSVETRLLKAQRVTERGIRLSERIAVVATAAK
jgi:hypothetical protein